MPSAHRWCPYQIEFQDCCWSRKSICRTLVDDPKASHILPGWQQIDVIKSIYSTFKPLSEVTNVLSEYKYATVSCILPLLSIPKDIYHEAKYDVNATVLTREILDIARAYMYDKYENSTVQRTLQISTLLNPRYKIAYMPVEALDMITACHWWITSLHGGRQRSCTPYTPTRKISWKRAIEEKTNWLMSKGAEVALGSRTNSSPLQVAKKEMDRYLFVRCEELSIDPLDWWKASSKTYPDLSKVARIYVWITATSTPSERLFSTVGWIITSKRDLLKPELAETLIFSIRNAWYCWLLYFVLASQPPCLIQTIIQNNISRKACYDAG